jgi:cell shape-determining protein MreC
MLAEKSKQQEELLAEYEDQMMQNKETESEIYLLQSQVSSIREELKVYMSSQYQYIATLSIAVAFTKLCQHGYPSL